MELKVFGIGVATVDPELRYVGTNNTAVCSINLAFNRRYKDKDGNWQSEPCFLKTQSWGSRAERMAEIVKKGCPIYVCGYLKQDSWNNNEGKKIVSYHIHVNEFAICTKNDKFNNQPTTTPNVSANINNNDDIPF